MSSFPNSPQILKAGLVIVDPETGDIRKVVILQYNPETLSRSFEVAPVEGFAEDVLRRGAPPGESISMEAEIDATDQLETPEQFPDAVESGIHPQLAALECLLYPNSDDLVRANEEAGRGVLEIAPVAGPLVLFVWSRHRVMPVAITSLSIAEEAFDTRLNPIRARVSISLRVLSVKELGFEHRGGKFYLGYQKLKEQLAEGAAPASLGRTGLDQLPAI